MSVQMYFINETKKQIVDSKKLYGDFEDKQQLLCYLNLCQGDTIRTAFEGDEFCSSVRSGAIESEYVYIPLYDYKIYTDTDLYKSKEFDRLYEDVNKQTANNSENK